MHPKVSNSIYMWAVNNSNYIRPIFEADCNGNDYHKILKML